MDNIIIWILYNNEFERYLT